jgi:hypothetical protein
MMIPQNKNVCQLLWHLYYVDTAVENSELYCYNTEGDRNSVKGVMQNGCDSTRTACLQWNVDSLEDYFEGL